MKNEPIGVEPYNGSQKYIFISYSHEDKALVYPLLEQMKQEGYRFWYDHGIHGGQEWEEEIARRIKMCEAFIIFVTSNSASSANCANERAFAQKYHKRPTLIYVEKEAQIPDGFDMSTLRFHRVFMQSPTDVDGLMDEFAKTDELIPCRGEWIMNPAAFPPITHPSPKPQKAANKKHLSVLLPILAVLLAAAIALFAIFGPFGSANKGTVSKGDSVSSNSVATSPAGDDGIKDEDSAASNKIKTVKLSELSTLKQAYTISDAPAYDVFGTLHAEQYQFGTDWVTKTTESKWVLNKEYTTFSCDITFFEDQATRESTALSFYADDRLVHFEPNLQNQSRVYHITFDVSGAQTLTLQVSTAMDVGGASCVSLVNTCLK